MDRINITLPMTQEQAASLMAGDSLSISGIVYTARDAAHKRLVEAIAAKEELPFDLLGAAIYYVGPCPEKPGQVIGSAGPTTSSRMDPSTPLLIQHGLRVMIGKGQRDEAVIAAMKQYGAVYLGATGGAGALLAQHIVRSDVVAWPDLGPEAIRKLVVKDFPVIVLIDSRGNNLYDSGRRQYRR
ncbi:MAG: Fe-S-containing hydro-lyase [Bacillota bacterium]|nr:Fe-S-containing hydro-lyase [Bacillota bacterium]